MLVEYYQTDMALDSGYDELSETVSAPIGD